MIRHFLQGLDLFLRQIMQGIQQFYTKAAWPLGSSLQITQAFSYLRIWVCLVAFTSCLQAVVAFHMPSQTSKLECYAACMPMHTVPDMCWNQLRLWKMVVLMQRERVTHPKTARANAVARNGSLGAAVMKAHAIAVTEQPAAVIFVIIASPLDTFRTCVPSVICTASTLCSQHLCSFACQMNTLPA